MSVNAVQIHPWVLMDALEMTAQPTTEGESATVATPGLLNFTRETVKMFTTISKETLGNTEASLEPQQECARHLGKTEAHWLTTDRLLALLRTAGLRTVLSVTLGQMDSPMDRSRHKPILIHRDPGHGDTMLGSKRMSPNTLIAFVL